MAVVKALKLCFREQPAVTSGLLTFQQSCKNARKSANQHLTMVTIYSMYHLYCWPLRHFHPFPSNLPTCIHFCPFHLCAKHHFPFRQKTDSTDFVLQLWFLPAACPYTQIHKYTNTNTQIHKYTNTQIHKYTNTQIHKYR